MTRKEAIVFLKNANAQSELALKELLKIEDKAKRIGKIGEYYANFENCVKEIEACNIAISALEELEKSQTKIGGWIPCSERLPDKGVMNPITNDYAEYLCTVCVDGFRTVRPIKFDKDGCWVNHGMNFDKYVTAWQPLPEAYHG